MMLPEPRPPVDGPVLALFDMDKTLLTANSATLWLKFERQEGRMSRVDLVRGLLWIAQYHLGIVDMDTVTRRALALSAGDQESALKARTERWYRDMVRDTISAVAVARLEAHRRAGHDVAILTASTQFGAEPLARELSVEHLVCTRLEVGGDGRLTGRVDGTLCYGPGKLERARAFAEARGAKLSDAWFYSDSYTDLPVLEAVAHPVAVNADPRLARHARRRGWPVVRFD
jgi:HAD superfamily hydrolase (TIGR01490 family)